jgi:uncharacterized protein DUF4440
MLLDSKNVLAVLFAVALAGCQPGTEVTPPPATTTAGTSATTAAAAVLGPVDEAVVRAVVDAWLAAQNGGDFAAYEKLYAAKLEGIRRSGPRTQRFGRDGWLADRKRMFEKKMVVAATDVQIVPGAGSARVRFVQKWSSGTFEDEGPKEMILVPEAGGWKIAREEMLQSKVAKPDARPIDQQRFAYVVHAMKPRVVLAVGIDEAWLKGSARLLSDGSPVIGEMSVDAAKLPPALASWQGRDVRMFGPKGEVCRATISGIAAIGRAEPHFGTRALWKGKPEDAGLVFDEPVKPATPSEIAGWALSMAAGDGQLLVGDITVTSGACGGAIWARDAAAPVPKAAEAVAAPKELEERALDAFRKLPAWISVETDFHRQVDEPGHWDEHDSAKPVVQLFHVEGGPTFVGVVAEAGTGCGDFGATLFALFEEKNGGLVVVNDPSSDEMPMSAVDIEGDGLVELLYLEGILRSSGARWDVRDGLHVPFYDCGC